jgi:aromatic-L-amino-acid decarboxylase
MKPDDFRRHGHAMVEWIARYMEEVERYPVKATIEPGSIYRALPPRAPEEPEPFEAIVADLDRVIIPGITHWQSPSFFAYFPANTSPPSILGDLLCAGLGVQGMLWATSPACTELEMRMLEWARELLGLPERFSLDGPGGGVIQDTASSAALCALLAARERALGGAGNREGLAQGGVELVAYASTQAHSSIEKAVRIAGVGSANLRSVAVDASFAMDPSALAQAMEADVARGARPFFICATLGTTASGAFDPLPPIAALAAKHGAWLHVDAAMFGTAAACPELRHIHAGVEQADSYCFNPHKWMLTGFDCDCFYVADRLTLLRALGILPEYLRTEAGDAGAVIDFRDWQIPLGRRFRALKLWCVMRSYGAEGIRAMVRRHIAWANELAGWVREDPRFEIAAPHPFNLVCFRHKGGDAANRRLMEALNATGELYLSHCELDGRIALRVCIAQSTTTREHVAAAWRAIQRAASHAEE